MRPRCSVFTGAFDFSPCGDCKSLPPIERPEISNSDPSAIVLHGIPCIGGLYITSISRNRPHKSRRLPHPCLAFLARQGGHFDFLPPTIPKTGNVRRRFPQPST